MDSFLFQQSARAWADREVVYLLGLLEKGKVTAEDFAKKRKEIEEFYEGMISDVEAQG